MWDWKGLTSSNVKIIKPVTFTAFWKTFTHFQTNVGTFTAFWIVFLWKVGKLNDCLMLPAIQGLFGITFLEISRHKHAKFFVRGADLDGIATEQLRNDPFFSLLVQWDFLSGKLCWIIGTKWFAKLTGILFSFSRFMSNPIQPEYLPIISKIWFQCYPIFIEFRTFISIFFFSKLSNIMSVGLDGWNYESRMGVWYVFLINHFHWLCALIEISKHNNLFPPRMFFLIVYFPINFETVRSLGPVFRFTTWILSKLKIPPMSNSNTKTYRIQPQKCVSFPFVFQLSKQNFYMHRYGTYTFSSRFQECFHNFVTTFQVFTLGFRNFIMKFLWTWKRKTPNLAFWLQFQRDKLLLFCAKTLLE